MGKTFITAAIATSSLLLIGCDEQKSEGISHWSATVVCHGKMREVVDEAQSSVINLCYNTSDPVFCDDVESMFLFNEPSIFSACAANVVVWADRDLHSEWQFEGITADTVIKTDGDKDLTLEEATLACRDAADLICSLGASNLRDACYGTYWTAQYNETECELLDDEFRTACSNALNSRGAALQMCSVAMTELDNR